MNLRDSVIIVTGSATGLGAAIVKQVAGKGARVVINYTKSEKEAHETEAVCDYLGVESLLCKADISSDEDCRRLAAEAMEKWGRIDGLVNNAARSVFANNNDLETLTGQDFMDVYSVNVVGTYQMTRAAAPHMKAQGNGSIVNVSSISALTGAGSSIAYVASKGAFNTMTTALARALAPEIRVNAVLPGAFPSRWWGDGLGEEGAKALFEKFHQAQVPLKIRRGCGLSRQDSGLAAGRRRLHHRRDDQDRLRHAPAGLSTVGIGADVDGGNGLDLPENLDPVPMGHIRSVDIPGLSRYRRCGPARRCGPGPVTGRLGVRILMRGTWSVT